MERLLTRLERRFGKLGISGLPTIVVGGMAVVFLLGMLRPPFLGLLALDVPRAFGHGGAKFPELWRLFTYLFLPNSQSPIWVFFEIWWSWIVLSNLESAWGAFRLTAFYAVGMVATTLAAVFVGGAVGNLWLNLSVLLAFATVFPDYEIYVFFVLPIRMKWIALVSAGFAVFSMLGAGWYVWAAMIAGISNYVLFCGGTLIGLLRGRTREVKVTVVRRATAADAARATPPPVRTRVCAICGAKEEDGADIRVCSCEKCGGKPRTLCLEHARNH
jgi:membrane associated rhomboid family serine protease